MTIFRNIFFILTFLGLFSCGGDDVNNMEEESVFVELEAAIEINCPTFNTGTSCEVKDISQGQISRREWFFENAETNYSTQVNPTITFEEIGNGTITLVVHDDLVNLSDTANLDVIVYPSTGLIAYYPLNNSVEDFSGNTYHGVVNGAEFVQDVDENQDLAIRLNDFSDNIETSSEIDDFLTYGVTFSAWIKAEESFDLGPIISNLSSNHMDTCQSYTGFQFYYGSERGLGFNYYRGGNGFGASSDEHNNFGINEWHHVSATWNGAFEIDELDIVLYIDGERTSGGSGHFNNSFTQCPFTESPIPFYIGRPYQEGLIQTNKAFIGCLDELRIYNRPLELDEIKILSQR